MNKDIALALRIRVLLFWGKIAFRVRICFIVHRRNCFWSKALFHEWSEVPSCLPMSVRELSASLCLQVLRSVEEGQWVSETDYEAAEDFPKAKVST